MAKQFEHPFKKTHQEQVRQFKRLPQRISQWGLLEIKENFRRQGYYTDQGIFKPWRKRRGERSLFFKKKKMADMGRALLIKTGRLRRSLRAAPVYMTARVVTDVPYAEALNNGFKGTIKQKVKAFNRRQMGKFGIIKTKSNKKSTSIKFGRGQIGLTQVKAHSRTVKMNLPARRFMATGKKFNDMVEQKILTELDQIFVRI